MKKYLAIVAAAVMVAALALVGCSSGGSSSSSASSANSSSSSGESTSSAASGTEASGDIELLKDGTITFATSPDYPPFENLEGDEYVGLDIAIAQAVADKLGLECEFKNLQFDTIISAIAAGGQADAGISGITIDPEREKQVDFSEPYYIDDQAIAVMNGSAITEANADEELNKEGVIIAVQSGTSGEAYIEENYPNATVQPYGNSTDAFAAMQAGQANAVCTNLAVVNKMLADAYPDATVVKEIATGEEYAIAVSQDNPALTEAINAALVEITEDGTFEALLQQFL